MFVFGTSIGLTYQLVWRGLDKQEKLLNLTRKGWQETGVSPVGTLHNHKDVTSVRVEDFPSPDAKMMMEVKVKLPNSHRKMAVLQSEW